MIESFPEMGHYEWNIVEIEMRSLYYRVCGKQEYPVKGLIGNSG